MWCNYCLFVCLFVYKSQQVQMMWCPVFIGNYPLDVFRHILFELERSEFSIVGFLTLVII